MKRALAFFVAALLALSPVAAQTWATAGENDRAQFDADLSSIAKHRIGVKVWLRANYKEPQESATLHPTKFVRQTFQSTMTLYVFDCSERLMGTLQYVEYSATDGAGETIVNKALASPPMSDVVPGSMGASWLDGTCARARKLKLVK